MYSSDDQIIVQQNKKNLKRLFHYVYDICWTYQLAQTDIKWYQMSAVT